ncbi:M56 family metallopeptidase [Anaerovorax sp. IOR16]|uniref:M56 family metallopeptidase n=1 Tax=Anaerovorax sp. IOR16 TaxID=2773458 RepID=UPI0019D30BB9|nr:M56 family metallopeptidase [Anaerovorax sp. IOR16]
MLHTVFSNFMSISLFMSPIIIMIYLLSPLLDKRYYAKWKYYLGVLIIIQLLVPFTFFISNSSFPIHSIQMAAGTNPFQSAVLHKIESANEILSKSTVASVDPTVSFIHNIPILWILSVIVFAVFHILRYQYTLWKIKPWFQEATSQQNQILYKLQIERNIHKYISVMRCAKIKSPLMYGIIKPRIIIPCIDYSEKELLLIFKHELTHYEKHHLFIKSLMFISVAFHWFNPFAHMFSHMMNETIELCCDEDVIHMLNDNEKKRYLETLLKSITTSSKCNVPQFTTNYSGGIKMMKKRFTIITTTHKKKKGLPAFLLAVILCISMSILAGCRVDAENGTITGLPNGMTGIFAENQRNEALEKLIIEANKIPEEYLEKTFYYYNYVDLNDDGNDEIFAVVMGPYTSGTGGSTGMIISQNNGNLTVQQILSLIRTPIIVSENTTNGYHDLLVEYSGGGVEPSYVSLTYKDGAYTGVSYAEKIEKIDDINGTIILCNDIEEDIKNDKVFFLK